MKKMRGNAAVRAHRTVANHNPDPTAPFPPRPLVANGTLRILLLCDEPALAERLAGRLRDIATPLSSLECVTQIDAALAALERGQHDVLLTAPQVADEPRVLDALAAGADDYIDQRIEDGGSLLKTLRYVVERKYTSRHLTYLAHYDKLTGLANRELFRDRVQHALRRAERSDHMVALLSLDLDRFKSVNESLGHGAGDELLVTVAYRLASCMHKMDTIARIGSDEFAILIEDVADRRDVEPLCQKLLASMAEPMFVRGEEVYATASIGVSFYPVDAAEVGDLMRKADNAMFRAKGEGRGRFCLYTPTLHLGSSETMQLEAGLRRALHDDALFLCYQPKICLQTGRVLGAEALLRWQHPRLGTLMPDRFVPLAEDSGLIVPIGEWVLQRACEDLKRLCALGHDDLTVAVNLSTRQFRRGNLGVLVESALEHSGADPNQLELEITESLLLEDSDTSRQQLDAVKAMGVMVYLDDFGTGYSSLSYLKRFRIDGLKIDRSFIRDVPGDADDAAITRAIIALSRALRLSVIAEGVENEHQLELLLREGCDAVQGFLFAEPMTLDEFLRVLPQGFAGQSHLALLAEQVGNI